MSPLIKNVLFALGLAVLLYLGYTIFFGADNEAVLSESGAISGQAAAETQEFLIRLQQLQAVKIDSTLFTDPRFEALEDFRQNPEEEASGRANPFIPVGG